MKLLGPWKTSPTSPPTVATDTIIPFHFYDNSKHTNGLVFDLTFRFDDILSAEKLQLSLSRLLELGDWRKLGARIRRNERGELDYHVPTCFNEKKRPGFMFSTANFEEKVDDYAQAALLVLQPHKLDTAGQAVALGVPNDVALKHFMRSPGFPECLDDWLCTDAPQLGIHVIHFQDATLVTISFLHSLTDMMGLNAILEAWTRVLQGEEEKVEAFVGFERDVLEGLKERKRPESLDRYQFEGMLLQGWRFILFAVGYLLWIEIFWPRREDERIIFLPREHLTRMRAEVMEELASQPVLVDGEKIDFVSEADVIFAWWTRNVLRAEKTSPSRTISMRNTCCCRTLLDELQLIPSTDSALVTNAVFGVFTFLKVHQVLEQSLAFTASQIRRALIQQRKASQLLALDAIRRQCIEKDGHGALFGDSNMFMFMISNWEKAKLFQVDFSPAVMEQGLSLEKRKNLLGRPSSVQGNTLKHYATRNTGVVIGKDAGGNYWLAYSLRKEAWEVVERELSAMSDRYGQI